MSCSRGALPGLGCPPPESSSVLPSSGTAALGLPSGAAGGRGPCFGASEQPLLQGDAAHLLGEGGEPFSISFRNSFLVSFCSFKCLLASDHSLSSYKRFCSPSRAARSGTLRPSCRSPEARGDLGSPRGDRPVLASAQRSASQQPPSAAGVPRGLSAPLGPTFGWEEQPVALRAVGWVGPGAPALRAVGLSRACAGSRELRWLPPPSCCGTGLWTGMCPQPSACLNTQRLHPGPVLGPGCSRRGCPGRGLPRGRAGDGRGLRVPRWPRGRAAGCRVQCDLQRRPSLALFPLLWLVTTQAVGLQLLRGLHVAFSLEVGCRCGGRRWQEPKGAGWT